MSKKIYGPRQSQAKTGLYDLMTNKYTPTGVGRPKKETDQSTVDRLRNYNIKVKNNEADLLKHYSSGVRAGSYGGVANDSYNQIMSDIEVGKNPNASYKDLITLLDTIRRNEEKGETDFDVVIYNQFPKYTDIEPNLIFHSGKEYIDKTTGQNIKNIQQRKTDQIMAPYYDMAKDTTLKDIQNPIVQTSIKYKPQPPNKPPPNTPYIQNLLDNFPSPQEVGVMRESIKPASEFTSRAYMDGIKPTRDYINPIVDQQKAYINPIVDSKKGYINPIVDKAKKHVFGVGSSTPSPLIPDDLQNLEAYQYEQHYGVPIKKTYGVDDEQKRMFETREERDARKQLESYKDEIQLLGNRPNSSFRGADIYDKDDMAILKEEGNSAGGAELGKPYKPDIFNNMNPTPPVGQTAKGRIGLPTKSDSQKIYPSISGVPLPNYNRTQQRPLRPEGISGNDNLAQDRRVQIMDNRLGGSEGLGMRVTRTFADMVAQQNALTNVGGGIMSQIANSLRQSADSGEEKKNGDDGLYGAEGSMFNNQDVSNPRTLDQRFSRLGQQRMTKDFKINKYTNLKKLNKQKYDTVTAPSLKEIRARTLGYVQPNSKVAGNSVELIRQSNATQMKLNNMFMP